LTTKKKFPLPVNYGVVYIERMIKSPFFTLYLPGGDSYDLSSEDMEKWLLSSGVEDVAHVLSYIWNFHTVLLNVEEQIPMWVSSEDLHSVVGNRPSFVAIL